MIVGNESLKDSLDASRGELFVRGIEKNLQLIFSSHSLKSEGCCYSHTTDNLQDWFRG